MHSELKKTVSIVRTLRTMTLQYVRALLLVTVVSVGGWFLSGCGNNRPSSLVGQWVCIDGRNYGAPRDVELFKDGTGLVEGSGISWKVENNRLVMVTTMGGGVACNYKIIGGELILEYEDGHTEKFAKKDKKNYDGLLIGDVGAAENLAAVAADFLGDGIKKGALSLPIDIGKLSRTLPGKKPGEASEEVLEIAIGKGDAIRLIIPSGYKISIDGKWVTVTHVNDKYINIRKLIE
jgi:hypothetical protein